ncbi:MAG TPA: molecular chaperone DnaJ [Actinomycetota bacterium]
MAADLYEILGIARSATQEDIKKAYRRLARELHPDVSGDPTSEERFKEVTAAYEILSDPEKRRQYDMYGHGGGPDMFPFTDVADIFEAFFGAGTFGRRRPVRRSRTQRGEDAVVAASLTFEEAAFGAERRIDVDTLRVCERCGGNGAEPGSSPRRCGSCGGTGQIQDVRRSIFGTVMTARPCPTCDGTGEELTSPCTECRGQGRAPRSRTVTVEIPAGVSDGVELRVPGEGHAGRAGGPPGDLYVSIAVAPSPVFERREQDLFALLDVSMEQAALGAEVEVATLDGTERVKLDPGVESGSSIRLRGKGIPNLGRRGRGDLYLTVYVETPRHLGKQERRLLEQLAELRGQPAGKGAVASARLRRPT